MREVCVLSTCGMGQGTLYYAITTLLAHFTLPLPLLQFHFYYFLPFTFFPSYSKRMMP